MSTAIQPEEIPQLIKESLVEQYGDSQDRCYQGYLPSQSIRKVMEFLGPEQIQFIKGKRLVKDESESFKRGGHDLPDYVKVEEQLKRELKLRFDKYEHAEFEWNALNDYLTDSELEDVAISKLVFRMENPDLRDHLFDLLQHALNYPDSYKSEFTDPFYFVMESRSPDVNKDYDNVDQAHEQRYLQELGWSPRCLDLLSIWSHYAWVKSGNKPMGVTQREVEELSFNQRQSDEPVFGAVNSPLVINRWRSEFSRGLTDVRQYEWQPDQKGWVRSG